METVFDYNPTPAELEALGFLDPYRTTPGYVDFPDPLTPDGYRAAVTSTVATFDLFELFSYREDAAKAQTYGALIPDIVQQYRLGFDYQATASDTL